MTATRLTDCIMAAIIAAAMSTAYLLDAPTEYQARTDAARSAIDAGREARQQARFERAAQAMCGANAAFEILADNSVQCFTHRGAKTIGSP